MNGFSNDRRPKKMHSGGKDRAADTADLVKRINDFKECLESKIGPEFNPALSRLLDQLDSLYVEAANLS